MHGLSREGEVKVLEDIALLDLLNSLESPRVERKRAAGNPPPEFEVQDTAVLTTVRRRP